MPWARPSHAKQAIKVDGLNALKSQFGMNELEDNELNECHKFDFILNEQWLDISFCDLKFEWFDIHSRSIQDSR